MSNNLEKAFKTPRPAIKSALSAFLLLLSIFILITIGSNKSEKTLYEISSFYKEFDKKERQDEAIFEKNLKIAPLYNIAESPRNLEKIEIDTSSLMPSFEEMDYFSKTSLNANFGEALMDFEEPKLEIFEIAQLDKTPRILKRAKVEYPRNMLSKDIEGRVDLIVLIDENGNLSLDKVKFATNEYFEQAALKSLGDFKYEAPEKLGKKVKARFILPIPFTIERID